jgi:tetratricopeptide (TPR) repeat protein
MPRSSAASQGFTSGTFVAGRAFHDMTLRTLVLLAALAAPAIALADDKGERDLGRGYRLEVTQAGLVVTRAGGRAPLQRGVFELGKLVVGATQLDLDVGDITCAGTHHYTWTFGHLDARLANSAAFALHQAKKYQAAAEGFARAAAADPSWVIPAYNLASARVQLGDLDGALAALAARLASDPIATYVQISTDPELRPLLARQELAALRAKTPGTAKLPLAGLGGLGGGLVYAPERGLVAVVHEEHSWGSAAFAVTLELFDLKTGKLVAAPELVRWNETAPECDAKGCELKASARGVIATRTAQLEAMLGELGFSPTAVETANAAWNDAETKRKAYLPKAKLGVAAGIRPRKDAGRRTPT